MGIGHIAPDEERFSFRNRLCRFHLYLWCIIFHLYLRGPCLIKVHPEKCFVESTKVSIDPYLNEKLCWADQIFVDSTEDFSGCRK